MYTRIRPFLPLTFLFSREVIVPENKMASYTSFFHSLNKQMICFMHNGAEFFFYGTFIIILWYSIHNEKKKKKAAESVYLRINQ